jgi:prepilin-type N-terminal cleavage/methylation domain-containing protein
VIKRYREIKERREAGADSEYGFTLIELLIVIIVLGILAAIVIFSLTGVTGQSEAAACSSDAKTVETAVSAYYAENNDTPPLSIPALTVVDASGHGPYLRAAPTATVTNNGYLIGYTDTGAGVVTVSTKAVTGVSFDTTAGQQACANLSS